jgi:hypothetical protein
MKYAKEKKEKRVGEQHEEDQSEAEEPLEIFIFIFFLKGQKHAQETKTETVWSPPQNEVKMYFWMNLKFHPKTQPEHAYTHSGRFFSYVAGWRLRMDELTHFPIRPKSGQNEINYCGDLGCYQVRCVKENSLLVFAGYLT